MTSKDIVVGHTRLIEIDGIYEKLECTNPCGSIKDRMVKYILNESENKGFLKPRMQVIEATSGNTGIALSYYAKAKGHDTEVRGALEDLGFRIVVIRYDSLMQDQIGKNHDVFGQGLSMSQ